MTYSICPVSSYLSWSGSLWYKVYTTLYRAQGWITPSTSKGTCMHTHTNKQTNNAENLEILNKVTCISLGN